MRSEDSREWTDPAVSGGWERDFALTLRLRGFTGMQISGALAQVESRCSASKMTAREVFGDPVAHASYLRVGPETRVRRSPASLALPVLGLAAGCNLAFEAVLHWSDGVVISAGTVASIVLFIAVVVVLSRFLGWAMTSALNVTSCVAGGLLLTMLMQWALPVALASVHAFLALALGLLLVALSLVMRGGPVEAIPDVPQVRAEQQQLRPR
jgi:hypothetical protein